MYLNLISSDYLKSAGCISTTYDQGRNEFQVMGMGPRVDQITHNDDKEIQHWGHVLV